MALLSAVDEPLGALRIPRSAELDLRCRVLDLAEILERQLYACCAEVLVEALDLARAWNRNDPGLLRQQPGKRDLRWRGVLSLRHCVEQIDERVIRFPVLRRETRNRL